MEKMAALRKSQLHSILSRWCHQILSSRFPNYSTSVKVPNNSTPSHENLNPPSKEENDPNEVPTLPGPTDCCNEGCANCVWLSYVIKVEFHYEHNKVKVQEAINRIPKTETRTFVELELKKKLGQDFKSLNRNATIPQ